MNKQSSKSSQEIVINDKNHNPDLLVISESVKEYGLKNICDIKRFYERWAADKNFREQICKDPYEVVKRYRLQVDPEEVRPIWDVEFDLKYGEKIQISNSVKQFYELFINGAKKTRLKHSLSFLKDSRIKLWRERQIVRTLNQFHKCYYDSIVHAPVCFELTKGCSVGCWFCGVSAPNLGDIFTYTPENARLWREVLKLIHDLLGPAAAEGFCYWATDPLDNPDYEKFCLDFKEVIGSFPQTTTTQPLKNPNRTRRLLELSAKNGCKLNRFSVLSLKMLNQIHEEFSAEELASVYLVLQNPESGFMKANAGRMRLRNKKNAEQNDELLNDSHQPTIACVTGFLFNMVDRSVKLISPCPADDRWPNGYIIYDEGTFSDASSLKILLEEMIDKNMPFSLRYNQIIRFARDLKYENLPNGFQLSTRYLTRNFRNQPYLKELGEVIQKGDKTTKEIVLLFEKLGVPQVNILYSLNLLFNKGVLDEEPQPH